MPKTFTDNSFSSTYKDDWKDSDHYNRILFNPGRALQARELTQMQTIIQEGIRKFANNIYQKDGVPIKTGGISINNSVAFIKIDIDTNNSFDDVDALVGVELTGATSSIKVRIVKAVAAENGDPDTLYVQYLDDPTTRTAYATYDSPSRVTPGEVLTNGSSINMTVQTVNTAANPAIGSGSQVEVGESNFYANGHFIFVEKQQIFLRKYAQYPTENVGFKIVQDIVTVSDTDALYDNTNTTPNRSSPGADRYRIRLLLTKQSDIVAGDTFVYYCKIQAGKLIDQVTAVDDSFNSVKSFVNKRIKEINGDFIKKYWKLRVDINGNNASSDLMLRVDPGVAYIQGNRVETTQSRFIPLKRATDTIVRDDPQEQIGIDYGNFYYFDSGVGMLDIDTCETVNLYAGFGGTDSVIGTANIRAITEGTNALRVGSYTYTRTPAYKAHLFNVFRNNFNHSLRDVKSIKSASNGHLVNLVQVENNIGSILHEPKNNALLTDTPLKRPKSFTDVTMTFMKKYNFTATGPSHTITLTDAGETFVRESDVIVASATEFAPSGVSTSIQSGNKDIIFSGLSNGAYEVITFVKKTNASVKTKTLEETTVTATLDSDGQGVKYLNLGKSDVYSVDRIRSVDSDGNDVFGNFLFDAGARTTHYGDARLIWTTGGIDSEAQNIFVRYKYFSHSANGQFFAVNSYDGQLDYLKIPAQNLKDGDKLSLRDAIDLRPATDGSGSFASGTVFGLPTPTDTIVTTAEYYLPRKDKLLITKNGELQLKQGTPSLNPKYPETPSDALELYKINLNPNTMHSQDLETTLIPKKGYTMADISRLEEKVDKIEEMTTLSLLELNTKFLEVLDSAGNNRAKSGFFVDNFKDHQFSDTRSPEYRASIDKRNLFLKPTFVEECVNLYYDSEHSSQLRTVKKEDYVMLDYDEIAYEAQDLASGTENLAPFYNPQTIGRLEISPETDTWFETEVVGESVTGKQTKFDLKHALNWNNSENEWFGVDPTSLEVGDASSFQTGTSTSVTHNSSDPTLIGTVKTEELGEWVEVSNVTSSEVLYTENVELSRQRVEEISRSVIDSGFYLEDGGNTNFYTNNYVDGGRDAFGTNYNYVPYGSYGYSFVYSQIPYDTIEVTTDLYDVVTAETRSSVNTVNTTTYEATKTISTENTYEGTADIVTTTTTANTVNRIASASTIRDIVGEKIIDVSVIPFMRSIEIRFKAEGLRPNTQYFPFFDASQVASFCREETSYKTVSEINRLNAASDADGEGVQRTTQQHSKGRTDLITDAEGSLFGSFEVPNNVSMRFATGSREFSLLDVNAHNFQSALSYARARFVSAGTLEKVENEVSVTRLLKVVGENFNEMDRDVVTNRTTWTKTLIDTEIATDIVSSSTVTTIIGDTTTTKEFVDTDITYEEVYGNATTPVNHVTETGDTTPPGGTTADTSVAVAPTTYVPQINAPYDMFDEDVFFYMDPLAQTFLVKEESGVFLTTARVYFSSKADVAPVFCEIRPTVNGVPSATKILATKKLSPSQVSIVPSNPTNKTMLQNGTDFTFDAPIYLARGEYALVLRPGNNDPGYNCYVGTVGERQLGSTESFISQQPTLGGFFKSQNGKLWEPSSGQDMSYKLSVAKFQTSGNAILENVNIPPVSLSVDPFRSDSGSNTVRVLLRGHGLRDGDKTWIRGIDSATDFGNGLTGADVNGVRTVVGYDNSGYTFQASSNATGSKWFGGQSVTSQRNVNFEILRPELNLTQPNQTDITLSIKTATQQSLAGTETRFTKDAKYQIIENGKNNKFPTARAIYNRKTENLVGAGKLQGERSATMQVTMKTTNPLVSPILDLQRATLNCVHTLISRQDSAATDGFNVPLTYVGERNPQNGTESAKHVTTVTTLAEEAVGLKVLVSANKPPQADFQVYYRTAGEGDVIRKSAWTEVTAQNSLPSDTNPNVFREYRYLVGGDNGLARPFTQFQLKIVMRSTSSAHVPTFRDLRAIALAV